MFSSAGLISDLAIGFTSVRTANTSSSFLPGGTKHRQQGDIKFALARWEDYRRKKKLQKHEEK